MRPLLHVMLANAGMTGVLSCQASLQCKMSGSPAALPPGEKDAPAAVSALCLALSTSGMSTSNQATPVAIPTTHTGI